MASQRFRFILCFCSSVRLLLGEPSISLQAATAAGCWFEQPSSTSLRIEDSVEGQHLSSAARAHPLHSVPPDFIAPRSCPRTPVSYTHLRAHETPEHLVCRLLLEKKNP
eukprot:TRINITY_DN29858_c0_g1_i1.p3 TRINITY_DN29858_c0_g1~~TRINITY_DN29858_c0_g1_i1.p3  ORF type:complete len:109 (+),score=24.85 TRINITY_DN29858_c0_g1_i1:118-444(+)